MWLSNLTTQRFKPPNWNYFLPKCPPKDLHTTKEGWKWGKFFNAVPSPHTPFLDRTALHSKCEYRQEKTNYNEKYEIVLHTPHFNAWCSSGATSANRCDFFLYALFSSFFCAILCIFAWFQAFFAHILCDNFADLKFCLCYFVSFFHLWTNVLPPNSYFCLKISLPAVRIRV